ncbi:MAG TPA: hypothetical protein VFP84_34465 [Kofleriaceae bacterium]|nr:hypothetical protein [Kofleriaceae bacterium]
MTRVAAIPRALTTLDHTEHVFDHALTARTMIAYQSAQRFDAARGEVGIGANRPAKYSS